MSFNQDPPEPDIPTEVSVGEDGTIMAEYDVTDHVTPFDGKEVMVVTKGAVAHDQFNGTDYLLATFGGPDGDMEFVLGFPMAGAGDVIEMMARGYLKFQENHGEGVVEAEIVDGGDD